MAEIGTFPKPFEPDTGNADEGNGAFCELGDLGHRPYILAPTFTASLFFMQPD